MFETGEIREIDGGEVHGILGKTRTLGALRSWMDGWVDGWGDPKDVEVNTLYSPLELGCRSVIDEAWLGGVGLAVVLVMVEKKSQVSVLLCTPTS
jgi:hypothetical protein